MKKYFIIDAQQKGNLLQLALTSKIDPNTHGDDWDDKPYDSNAGPVYEEYVEKYITYYVPIDKTIYSYSEYNHVLNPNISMEDMFNKKIPFMYIVNDADFKLCDTIYLTDEISKHPDLIKT